MDTQVTVTEQEIDELYNKLNKDAVANGYNVHPCGSRGDHDSIGDLAVGLNAGQVRGADRNRLLEIEEELGRSAVWPGRAAYKGGCPAPGPAH